MTGKSPLFTLNKSVQMPALGLGVYQSGPDETVAAVVTAHAEGYRMIDTAAVYGNEAEVGQGIVRSGIDRSEVFVTTKPSSMCQRNIICAGVLLYLVTKSRMRG
ncbi:aldo/keto reductase [Pectobacterium actinidiae]|nr:aldo/keto reductase [Pectobacterium actinidiae]WEF10705.1 aldo/keto reductase [Pectobacterium actinidiae]